MKSRIEQIMMIESMNASRFADYIGLNRAALSHILSGRNNPSLDVVTKILVAFPKLNPDWLLFGKGESYSEIGEAGEIQRAAVAGVSQLFPPESLPQSALPGAVQPVEKVMVAPKKIARILIFYTDNTFETVIPDPTAQGL